MNTLFSTLHSWLDGRAAHVVHVGAGSGAALDAYQSMGCARVVLAEGDPDLASALSVRAASLPGIEAHAVALAPASGAMLWNRYNLRALNGPLDASALVALYPRLMALSTLPLQATGIADWLAARLPAPADAPCVMVLDVPGQEHALLSALPAALLQRFDALLVRGCGRPPSPDWSAATAIGPHLQANAFQSRPCVGDQDPLWPVQLFVADQGQRELLALRQEHARWAQRAKAEKEALAAQLATLQADQQALIDQNQARATAHETALLTLQEELDATRRERDEQAHRYQESAKWAQGLKAEKEALAAQLATLQADQQALIDQNQARATAHETALLTLQEELDATRRERDEQAHRHQESAKWAQGLKAEKEALAAQLATLQADQQALIDQSQARATAHETALLALQEQLDATRRERDEQARWHQENAKWAERLKAEKEALAAQLATLQADQQALIDQNQARATAHETALLTLQEELDATRRERDEQAHWHQENAKWAQGLKAEKEALEMQLAALQADHQALIDQSQTRAAAHETALLTLQEELDATRRERDEQAHWHQENAKWAQGLKAEKEALEMQLAALQADHQALIDQSQTRAAAHEAALLAAREALRTQTQDQASAHDAALQSLREQLDATRRERDEQAHWHQENAKWAQGLKAEKESLEKSLADAQAAHGALSTRMAERDARQRLLDAEILRAEAQLDLIKDVLIREKNF